MWVLLEVMGKAMAVSIPGVTIVKTQCPSGLILQSPFSKGVTLLKSSGGRWLIIKNERFKKIKIM